jgi:hypothetical protein
VSEQREILLADADVLIDYATSDVRILRLVSQHVGTVYVLKETLATVRQLSERTCRRNNITVIETEADVLLEAGSRSGPLSFEDWLCLLSCRDKSWSCVTNDRALLRECRTVGIRVHRGLSLMIMLVHLNAIDERRAVRVAELMHRENPHHISERVIDAFRRALRGSR